MFLVDVLEILRFALNDNKELIINKLISIIENLYPPIKPFNRFSCLVRKNCYIFVARKKEKLVITN